MTNFNESVIEQAIEGLNNLEPNTLEGSELHNRLFNEQYFIIGRYEAEQFLINHIGIFAAIGDIQKYEKEQFGEINTDLGESESVLNMWVYIEGERILNECETVQKYWDKKLNQSAINKITKELNNLLK